MEHMSCQMTVYRMYKNGYLDGTLWNIGDMLPQSMAPLLKLQLHSQILSISATLVFVIQVTHT